MAKLTRQNCKHFLHHLTSTLATDFLHPPASNSAFVANVHQLLGRPFQLSAKDSLQPLGEPSVYRFPRPSTPAPSVELLWLTAQCALPGHTKRCVLLLLLPLQLLLTARELVLTWSPAVFCVLTVLPPATIMWTEPRCLHMVTCWLLLRADSRTEVPKTSPRLAVCTKHFLRPC